MLHRRPLHRRSGAAILRRWCPTSMAATRAHAALTSMRCRTSMTTSAASSKAPEDPTAPLRAPPAVAGILQDDLSSLTARTYFNNPLIGLGVHHFSEGKTVDIVSDDEYIVDMDDVQLSPIVEVSSRVYVRVGRTETYEGRVIGGVVAVVNSNGTLGILLDNNTYEMQVKQTDLYLVRGRSKYTLATDYLAMMNWIRDAGVHRGADVERICSVLYMRGWRENRLYMLEAADLHCMTYLKKCVRMAVLEKAEHQREHHGEMRTLLRERVKEREWRYFIQKFSGFVSANWAGLGVMSVFLWQFKNYRKQQRAYQMKFAVSTMTRTDDSQSRAKRTQYVERGAEENWARHILRQMDITRPRIAVLTGFRGSGKTSLFRAAVKKENKPALFVEVRGSEDTLGCIIKSMKVPSQEACGDYLDFITDAFQKATSINGEPPIVVVTLREGSELSRVYNETVVLACDRRLCHLVFEVALEALTISNLSLPRVDFYHVPNFDVHQGFQYTQHGVDPVSLKHFVEVVGTNSNDIDELFSAMRRRKVLPTEYTNHKLSKSMRLVQSAWAGKPEVEAALKKLSESDYEVGQHAGGDVKTLGVPELSELVLYDPVLDRWIFKSKVFHSAVRCWS